MTLSELADVYDRIAAARSDPARARILADLFTGLDARTLTAVAHLTIGEVVHPSQSESLGIGPGLIRSTIATLAGVEPEEIDERVRTTGDLGEVAAELNNGDGSMTITGLWQKTSQAVVKGEDRAALLRDVLKRLDKGGTRYFVRMVINQMRISAGTGTIVRALERAFGVDRGYVEHLYAMSNDIGFTAAQARKGKGAVARTGLTLWRPYQFMNAEKMDDPTVIFSRLQGKQIIFEVKYDGARLQIHIDDSEPRRIRLYSRRLNDITTALPDVVAALQQSWKGGPAIVEGEAVAYDRTLKVKQPFQVVLTRLGRKLDVEEKAKETPFILYLFDMLHDDGEDLMEVAQSERRRRLLSRFRVTPRVKRTDSITTGLMTDQQQFFELSSSRTREPKACQANPRGLHLGSRARVSSFAHDAALPWSLQFSQQISKRHGAFRLIQIRESLGYRRQVGGKVDVQIESVEVVIPFDISFAGKISDIVDHHLSFPTRIGFFQELAESNWKHGRFLFKSCFEFLGCRDSCRLSSSPRRGDLSIAVVRCWCSSCVAAACSGQRIHQWNRPHLRRLGSVGEARCYR